VKVLPPKRQVILYGGSALIITCFFILFVFNEPFVNGHFLSTWLRYGSELNPGGWRNDPGIPDASEIEAAVRKAGPKAIPVLLEKIDARDTPWKLKLVEWQENATWLPEWFEIRLDRADNDYADAYYGFRVLGSNAAPAVADLARRLDETNATWLIVACLDRIGSPALPVFKSALTNDDKRVARVMLRGIGGNKDIVEGLLPELRSLSNDPDSQIAANALFYLLRFGSTNETTDLMHAGLSSTNQLRLATALRNIGIAKAEPRQFVPALSNLLGHPNLQVRRQATNTMKKVDLAAAFAAGIDTNPPTRGTNPPPRGRLPRR
jgi:hypothetical protein